MKKTKLHKVLAIVLTMLIVFAMPTVAASANDVPEPTNVELTDTEITDVELTDTEITDIELNDTETTDIELNDEEPTDTIELEVDDAPEISAFNGTMVLAKADTQEYNLIFRAFIEADFEKGLSGVTVELWEIDSNFEKIGSAIETKKTDSDGIVVFKGIKKGNYGVYPVSVPEGYILPNSFGYLDENRFDNSDNVDGEPTVFAGLGFNLALPGDTKYNLNYTVHETDFMGKKLSGVTVELWEINSSYEKVGSAIDTKTTNSNGEVTFKNLKKGNYALSIIAVPEGYILPPLYWLNGIITPDSFGDYSMEDGVPTVSSIVLIKPTLPEDTGYNLNVEIFEDNSYTKKVPGVTIELWKSDENTGTDLLIGTQTTNSDGDITFENVLKGNYVVRVVGVPEGYDLPTYVMQLGEESFDNYYLQNGVPTIGSGWPLTFVDDSSSSSSSGTTAQGSNPTGSTGSGSGSTGGSNSNFPQTGDNSNMLGYAFVSMFSLVALAVIAVKRKRINDR